MTIPATHIGLGFALKRIISQGELLPFRYPRVGYPEGGSDKKMQKASFSRVSFRIELCTFISIIVLKQGGQIWITSQL